MASIHRFCGNNGEYGWEGVSPVHYDGKNDIFGVVKHVLIGPADEAPNFVMRYFQVEPGKFTRLEQHPGDHGVILVTGRARVQLNDEFFELGPLDVVYIAGNDLHQFTNIGDEPMGFLCIIKPKGK